MSQNRISNALGSCPMSTGARLSDGPHHARGSPAVAALAVASNAFVRLDLHEGPGPVAAVYDERLDVADLHGVHSPDCAITTAQVMLKECGALRSLGTLYRHAHLIYDLGIPRRIPSLVSQHFQIQLYGLADVLQALLYRLALGVASGHRGDIYPVSASLVTMDYN